MDDMGNSGSYELRPLDDINNIALWMIWMILGHETMALKFYEQHKIIVNMNHFELWAQGSRCYEQLRVVDDFNDFRSWA